MSPTIPVVPPGQESEEMADTAETATDFNRQNPYGPGANADETRQAQHQLTNDSPVDVNNNAITARSQALTVDMAGKGFVAMQERRQILGDRDLKTE